MPMTTKCILASLAVVATCGVANAQYTTPQGDYLYQERYYNPGYSGDYYGGPYGPPRYTQPNYAPRSYYGPGTTPEGDYRSYGGPPSYYAPRYYGPRTGPEGDYYR
jgi:hypothetical protein